MNLSKNNIHFVHPLAISGTETQHVVILLNKCKCYLQFFFFLNKF